MPKKILLKITPDSYKRNKIQYQNINSSKEHTDKIEIPLEEFEAMRLYYYRKLSQSAAAERFCISQPTFSRILNSGTEKVVQAIVEGKDFEIIGGNVSYEDWNGFYCWECDHEWKKSSNMDPYDKFVPSECPMCGNVYIFPLKKIVTSFS